jgi:cysteine desulfuration protein SufE
MNADDLASAWDAWVADLAVLPDAHERLGAATAWGRAAEELPAALRDESRLVGGCVSRVWLDHRTAAGLVHFRVACDSPMVRGLAGVAVRFASGRPAAAVAAADLGWPARSRLDRQLTPTRLNGLAAVAARIRSLAAQAAAEPG